MLREIRGPGHARRVAANTSLRAWPHSCPGGSLARMEAQVSIERLLDRLAGICISEAHHGPAGARRFDYLPTYILRGLSRLHLEFSR